MSMKNSSDTIAIPTRDLPACSAVPQPTAPPRTPFTTTTTTITTTTTYWLHARHMTGFHNIHALLHGLFHQSPLRFLNQSTRSCHLLWLCCIICSMLNCFFSLSPYLSEHINSTVKTVSSLKVRTSQEPQPGNNCHGNPGVKSEYLTQNFVTMVVMATMV